MLKSIKNIIIIFILINLSFPQKILIPMDNTQNDHLKSYGLVYSILVKQNNIEWLLNYKGGSFLVDYKNEILQEAKLRGITTSQISAAELNNIYEKIENNNMDIILLEKSPKIAVYSPKDKQPWDDAVTLALAYAEVDYDIVFDNEVLDGDLAKYDWLHLHHEDFTGQYGKFYKSFRNSAWYKQQENDFNQIANSRGFKSVHELKKILH